MCTCQLQIRLHILPWHRSWYPAARCRNADIAVCAVQPNRIQHPVEKLARWPGERPSGTQILGAWSFSHDEDAAVRRPVRNGCARNLCANGCEEFFQAFHGTICDSGRFHGVGKRRRRGRMVRRRHFFAKRRNFRNRFRRSQPAGRPVADKRVHAGIKPPTQDETGIGSRAIALVRFVLHDSATIVTLSVLVNPGHVER